VILLGVRGLTKHFGPEPVLDGVTFDVRHGERIGLIGPNGSGKTTLLRMLAGREEADRGEIERHATVRIGFLEQTPDFAAGATVWDEAQRALAPLIGLVHEAERVAHQVSLESDARERRRIAERFDFLQAELHRLDAYRLDYKIARVLQGLGFAEAMFRQLVDTLSGGQQGRLSLAKLLLEAPDVMLLDEPSNHLDIECTAWLEEYLTETSQAMIVVSHDRYLLDRVTNRTLELFRGTVVSFRGNFSAYWQAKDARLETARRAYEKQQAWIARTEEFIRRNHAGQKHAQAEDRRKQLERIERLQPPRRITSAAFYFPPASRAGDIVLRAESMAKAFDRPLFSGLSFQIVRGERWGIVGPNGSGKTTLVRCLIGDEPLDEGHVTLGAGVRFAYFDQHLSAIEDDRPVIDSIDWHDRRLVEQERRDLLARFGLTGDMVLDAPRNLSGGERSRVALARLAAAAANLLVIDEPTNHLDLWARDALEHALREFDGTLIFVSHDRYFLNRVADHLLVAESGNFRVVEGNYEAYQQLAANSVTGSTQLGDGRDRHSSAAAKSPSRDGRRRRFPYRKVVDIEAEIHEREARLEAIYSSLSSLEVARDGVQVRRLRAEIDAQKDAISRLYEHWEESAEMN